jgi:hypothetical protein
VKSYKPRRDTVQRFEAAREQLTTELGRSPTRAEMSERIGYSLQRVAQIAAWLGLPKGRRVDLTQPIPPEFDELETRLLLNLRRLYALELQGEARSDAVLGLAAGYGGRPYQAAAEFRKAFTGQRAPTVDICRKMARAFGVDPVEIWRPIDDETLSEMVVCPPCDGEGSGNGYGVSGAGGECTECRGSGEVTRAKARRLIANRTPVISSERGGSGRR